MYESKLYVYRPIVATESTYWRHIEKAGTWAPSQLSWPRRKFNLGVINILNRFGVAHACGGRTDRQTIPPLRAVYKRPAIKNHFGEIGT